MKKFDFQNAVNAHVYTEVSDQVLREYDGRTVVATSIEKAVTETARSTTPGWDEVNVFEWWVVSNEFAAAARAAGEVIVDTPFGIIWGRQTCGQLISQDLNVQAIFQDMVTN
jgi:hypothetical protein